MDSAQQRLQLGTKGPITICTADFSRLLKIPVAHPAARACQLILTGRTPPLLLGGIAENPLQKIIHGYIAMALLRRQKFPISRCTFLTKILFNLSFRTDLRNMNDRFIAAAIVT